MIKRKFKKIFIFIIIFNLFLVSRVFAADLILSPSKDSFGLEEQFYIDLMLDPKGESINTVLGNISFSNDNIVFLRAEDGKSMINLWVEKPKLDQNKISFAGIISNGFEGVIDPFSPEHKLPGLIVRLVFETRKSGSVDFSTSTFSLYKNDGMGTEIKILPILKSIKINNIINKVRFENKNHQAPDLEAFIVQDQNIFNNKYTLIFKAIDKGTGIKSVMIKEGRRDWKEIESPYLLKDQARHSNITLQAINFSGAGTIINIDKIPYNWRFLSQIIIVIVIIIVSSILIFKKIHGKKK